MSLLVTISQRVIWGLVLLLAVLVLNFTLIHLAPGDPADVIAGEMGGATAEMLAEIRHDYGLDKPFHEQLLTYVGKVLLGDLGHSIYFDRPVTELIFDRLGATVLLVLTSLILALVVGTFLGVFASQNPNGGLSHFVTVIALLGYSLPVFWTGIMLLILLAAPPVDMFPISGMYDVTREGGTIGYIFDVLHHLILPVVTLSTIYLAVYSRLGRASMLDVLGADYIRTARAKGLSERVVVYKHALRNGVLPVVTFAGLQFSQLFSGAVLVETVFSWPGLGTLAFDSIGRRDTPMLLGILFFSALIVILANLATDVSYRLIDPRIKTGLKV